MKEAFLQSIREEYPNEQVTRLVFADWCYENLPELEHKLRIHIPIVDYLSNPGRSGAGEVEEGNGDAYGFGYLHEMPFGICYGNGYGFGYGIGKGCGHGYGNGNGIGHGFGSGDGWGWKCWQTNMPKLHSNQLIFLPNNFVFCGYVAEHIQPYHFKLTNASMINFHRENSWQIIATGPRREGFVFRKFDTITIGPQFFHSIDWIGDLP